MSAWNPFGLPSRITPREWDALRQWKRKYEVEAYLQGLGFTTTEARRLLFARWRFPDRRVTR
jgi:hypothetical protein